MACGRWRCLKGGQDDWQRDGGAYFEKVGWNGRHHCHECLGQVANEHLPLGQGEMEVVRGRVCVSTSRLVCV